MDYNFLFGPIDYIFLALMLLLCIGSFLKGFIHEAISIITLIISCIVAYKFHGFITIFIVQYFNAPIIVSILSFLICFLLSYLCLQIVIPPIIKKLQISLTIIDRLLGVLLGILKTLFVILVFYLIINSILPVKNQPPFLTYSFFREIVMPIEKQLFFHLNNDNIKLNNLFNKQ